MMATLAESARAQCPFYRSHTNKLIRCETLAKYGTLTALSFPSEGRRKDYYRDHCCMMDGGGCRVYGALMDKYK